MQKEKKILKTYRLLRHKLVDYNVKIDMNFSIQSVNIIFEKNSSVTNESKYSHVFE